MHDLQGFLGIRLSPLDPANGPGAKSDHGDTKPARIEGAIRHLRRLVKFLEVFDLLHVDCRFAPKGREIGFNMLTNPPGSFEWEHNGGERSITILTAQLRSSLSSCSQLTPVKEGGEPRT